jgi:tRNA(fMet)-specific endonuclease VapC
MGCSLGSFVTSHRPLSFRLTRRAAATFDELTTRRLRMCMMDLRIAAIDVSLGLVLLTRNVGDFGMVAELQTENWTV